MLLLSSAIYMYISLRNKKRKLPISFFDIKVLNIKSTMYISTYV